MASLFSRDRILGQSRRDSTGSTSTTTTITISIKSLTLDPLPSPFGDLTPSLTPTDLRDTLTRSLSLLVVPQPENPSPDRGSNSPSLSGSPSQRSITSAVASKMKKALGLRSSSSGGFSPGSSGGGSGGKVVNNNNKVVTVGELMRVHMKVSEAADSRIRRALLIVSAGQNLMGYFSTLKMMWMHNI